MRNMKNPMRVWVFTFLFFLMVKPAYSQRNPYAGERFHRQTELKGGEVFSETSHLIKPLPPEVRFKTYPLSPKIKLPPAEFKGLCLEEAIKKRRSVRAFSGEPLTLLELSQLLYAAAGITAKKGEINLMATPSHGETYPIEIYSLVRNVSGIAPGLYHYLPLEHSLELIKEGDIEVNSICINIAELNKAGVIFFLTAIPERITAKFDVRGFRYIYIEAGHISQNLYLQATSLGLGSVAIGSFYDVDVNSMLGIDGRKEFCVYAHVVGKQ